MQVQKLLLGLLLSLSLLTSVEAAEEASRDYGDTYTAEELEALSEALWAGNMRMGDMSFEKNYAKGYECFEPVQRMMADPLYIGQFMDQLAASAQREGALDKDMYRLLVNAGSLSTGLHNSDYSEYVPAASLPKLQNELTKAVGAAMPVFEEEEGLAEARRQITAAMAWHDFEGLLGESSVEEAANKELYELLTRLEAKDTYRYADFFRLILMLQQLPWSTEIFAKGQYLIIPTQHGRMAIGTYGDDYYEGEFAILIDPGGNDHYHNCRIGGASGIPSEQLGDGRVAYFADLGGDDFYDCGEVDITLGAAVLGVAAFYDLGGGNDRYFGGHCSLGAAMCGHAVFYDDGGSDSYSGKTYTQGAAGFGTALMVDDSVGEAPLFDTAEGNDKVIDAHERDGSAPDPLSAVDSDSYTAWSEAQAFARTRGIALCINQRGNETYHAGGVYLHAPLFSDRYQSFSQGFSIGEREIDYAGGVAMLIDYSGNDRYLGDIYNQGVGYWYSAGLLWDGAGNDLYEMTQYGQGSGIHLAIGGLIDGAGNDGYIMHSGLGQSGSHDYAASVLLERGGDDRYMGTTTCNGAAVTNSVAIFLERAGNDTYAGRREHGVNAATAARGFGSIGVLVDLAGKDDYLGIMADGGQWRWMDTGMGWDIPTPEDEVSSGVGSVDKAGENVPIPEIVAYEGELTQAVFDELWEISIRWEVGDNRAIVPKARERLAAFGPAVLPYINAEMADNYSLAVLAYVAIFNKLLETDRAAVVAVLNDNARSTDVARRITALRVIGDMKLLDAEDAVVALLDDTELERRAVATLGLIGSHKGDDALLTRLNPETPEPVLLATLQTVTTLGLDCYAQLRPLYGHPAFSVRDMLANQLAAKYEVYGPSVEDDYLELFAKGLTMTRYPAVDEYAMSNGLFVSRSGFEANEAFWSGEGGPSALSLRAMLAVFRKAAVKPFNAEVMAKTAELVLFDDWGVRADAVRTVKHWESIVPAEGETAEPDVLLEQLIAGMGLKLAEAEDHDLVWRAWGGE